ncbi:hypothetical protein DSO57_1034606 [Entomophthora muscae]|uniref:Uncharacterized protein n=1 Tax=Entomophthora muscae TaxID=34485 RepID=A0ACC2TLW7_9FUNG|nr:hypothetical protein DSO57_1034606 [Entomophthora muscae]
MLLHWPLALFFRLHNPFYPLFSEEAFYSKPRSLTLIKIVIQIGLERMPQSVLTTAAKKENNLTPDDFKNLPNSLDTLQCLVLTMISVWLPSLEKIRIKIWLHIDKLISLLGLHINPPSSPLWLERKLAKHLVTLGPYQAGLGQSCRFTNVCWLYTSNKHLSPGFLQRVAFHFTSDRIHYITSQGIYHSFTIIAKVNRAHALSLSNKDPAFSFLQELQRYMKHLQENFLWAWNHLSQCQGNKHLLVQSRLILTLRYHNDCIELGKLALHIPLNLKEPLTPTPISKFISCFSRDGINAAMRNIHLVSTINPQAFNPDYIRILIPSIAFIMVHCKPMKAQYGHTQLLYKALLQAKACLTRGQSIPNLKASATAYLELFDFLQKYHKILD